MCSGDVKNNKTLGSAGEIGQVGKSTYLHGFTAAVGILREVIEVEEQAEHPTKPEDPVHPSPESQ